MAPAIPVEAVGQRVLKKVQRVSKGQSFEFVQDYHHADTKITASEASCAPRNCDSYQQFGVPMQVFALSELSSFEKKQLALRLQRELDQVRTFQENIEGRFLKSSDTQRKPIHDIPHPVKKRVPTLPPATGNAMLMKQCDTLLKRLMGHNFGWVFNTPVDAVALKIPDYYTVIKHPMDLGTIKTKLNSGKYVVDPLGFADDVRLTFSNAMTYNPRGNNVHVMAETLSKFFEVRWKTIEKKLSVAADSVVTKKRNVLETEPETVTFMPPLKKKKIASFGNEKKQEPVKKIMSVDEKKKLNFELEASLEDLPENIIDFLKEHCSNGNATDDEIEIDIDAFGDETLFKLRKLLDEFLVVKQKNILNAEACEIEMYNDSGPSNSSMQAVKVNDVNEEDVDIGENDLPVTSFPPLEIEKDTTVKISKCSSSSSSSSDSGSSSSSDSDSESDDDANISADVNNNKATHSEVNLDQPLAVPRDTGDSVNRVEPKSESTPASGGCKEGVGPPNESQLSPDKLYRAAVLRGRFADIILKAQEKPDGKVEKKDKERLRLEKEVSEKRRKEEKARLQAEAEDAKQKAELEAKRKRELEREAARQALQKVEKMVDINDNSLFIEDLKLLSVAHTQAQPSQNLIEENNAEDALGFNMNLVGNPLEQLGLYMKNDDEDDQMLHDFEEEEID